MSKVTLTTILPLPATTACALARTPELFEYVVHPFLTTPNLRFPQHLEPGAEHSARLWWFGAVPSWRHHLRLIELSPTEIRTEERGGPVHTWNHRLTFEPLTATSCRYTDEVEIDDGVRGFGTRVFVHLMFRWRHRRWQALARVLAGGALEIRPVA
ncbi:hypothetical protein [Nocardia aurantia]|uniref:SRPBCC family protein n=1 Tax=Nocardia aurantia TaxID=2585199 RepID=A0A7K0DWG8_9NOCA|nr:hypothetical protein [Nocardia aurantia]MQY29642.1 hypothetical protein [Nocardia aurantia]